MSYGKPFAGALAIALIGLWALSLGPFSNSDERSDELTYRLESFNLSLNPHVITDTQSRRVVDMLHAQLISMGPDKTARPEIAKSWNWIDPNRLEVKLRKGLKFSDGSKITAEDAVWSLCRLVQPTAPYAWLLSTIKHSLDASGKTADCDGLEADGEDTVRIEVTSDPSRLLPALASSSAAIVPKGSKPGEYGSMPGAGPYVVERIEPNSSVSLTARTGGPLTPNSSRAKFQYIADDTVAATLFKSGKLDVVEITNPTLHKLLVADGKLSTDGRLLDQEVQQIRLLLFNKERLAEVLSVDENTVQAWIHQYADTADPGKLAQRFASLAAEMTSSYFPANTLSKRPPARQGADLNPTRELVLITESDPYSSAIASELPKSVAGVEIDYVGLDKSVLVGRLLKKDYDIGALPLEAMMNHNSYWQSFFLPGSPFTIFGTPLEGIQTGDDGNSQLIDANAKIVDTSGNWLILFKEKHSYAFRPGVSGESFLQTGLINYVGIGRSD